MIDSQANAISPQTIGDYLVSSIEPGVEVVRHRLAGLSFTRRVYRLFNPEHGPTDFATFMKNSSILLLEGSLNLPAWFDKSLFVERRTQTIQKWMEKDAELSRAIRRIEGKDMFRDEATISSYTEAFETLNRKIRETYEIELEQSALAFLNSDMPDEYFLTVDEANTFFVNEINVLSHKSKELEARLKMVLPRGFVMFSRVAGEFKTELSPLTAEARALSASLMKLRFQVSLWNSNNMDEFLSSENLTKDRLVKEEYDALLKDTTKRLTRATELLLPYTRYSSDKFILADETKEFQRSMANLVLA